MPQQVIIAVGDRLFHQGDEGRDAFIILRGRVRISAVRRGVDGVICDLGPGEMLGELALIDGGARTATATALEETTFARVTNAQIAERLSKADPVLALLLQRVIRALRREIQDGFVLPEVEGSMIDRIRLEGDLAGAVERNELELWYQPIVDIQSRSLEGFEALVRWRHPTRGMVSPAEFIPLAEESGLIVPIGAWVLHEGARTLRLIDEAMGDGAPRFMSVNVSGRQLEDSGFLSEVNQAVVRIGLPKHRLHLELTEGVLIQSAPAREAVWACKSIGVGLFLDDFGTGYSSLAYLNQLPFDALKIDHSFARRMEEEGDGPKLILAIMGLATTLGRGVVMEGIETVAQREVYRGMGGRLAQGYLFSRPLPLPKLLELIAAPETLPWG